MVHHIAKLLTRRPALAALFVVVAGLAVWAQAGGIEEARKRWRDLPEERRREIAERYEKLAQAVAGRARASARALAHFRGPAPAARSKRCPITCAATCPSSRRTSNVRRCRA